MVDRIEQACIAKGMRMTGQRRVIAPKSKASAPVSTTAATSIVGRQLDVSLM